MSVTGRKSDYFHNLSRRLPLPPLYQVLIYHSRTSPVIDAYIKDTAQCNSDYFFDAVETIPCTTCTKRKADWALKWIFDKRSSFAERLGLVAFAAVEGIIFSGYFLDEEARSYAWPHFFQ
jgi:hypothetical protein